MEETIRAKAPWHLWAVGIVALLWFSGGAWDYLQTQLRNEAYLGEMADSVGVELQVVLDYYDAFPAWAEAMWAISVWGAVFAALLLLARSRFAFHAALVSLLGLAGTTAYTLSADMPDAFKSTFAWVFSAVIVLSIILFALYARRMTDAGVLR